MVSADIVFPRTVELLSSSVNLLRVTPPKPVVFPPTSKRKALTFMMTHAQRDAMGELAAVFPPMMMWEVDRPEFVIDESELPY